MAPPDYAKFGTFTDTEFRDVFHRRQHQIVPTGNVIQKLHTHYDTANSAPILSSIQASSMDATNTQGAWNLLLRSATNPLSQESITTANTAAWTANAIITATPNLTTLRSGNVHVTSNITVSGTAHLNQLSMDNLRVNGNARLGDTFVVRQDTAYVGISTLDPAYSLDVNGDINSQGLIRILGTPVLSATDLGATITQSNLETLGTLTALTVDGESKLGQTRLRTFNRTIPTGKTTVDICNIVDPAEGGGTFMVEFTVVQCTLGNAFADRYIVPVRRLSTGGQYVWLIPVSSTGDRDGNKVGIQMKCDGSSALAARFRLARSGSIVTGDISGITVSLTLNQDSDAGLIINPTSTTSEEATPTSAYQGTILTTNSKSACVGINVFEPDANYSLDVNGAAKATNMDVTGNTKTGNATHFTLADSTAFNFSDKMRFYYNEGADALEIQRKIGGTWTKTATLAV